MMRNEKPDGDVAFGEAWHGGSHNGLENWRVADRDPVIEREGWWCDWKGLNGVESGRISKKPSLEIRSHGLSQKAAQR